MNKSKIQRWIARLENERAVYVGYRSFWYIPETFGYARFTLAIAFIDLKIIILRAFL